MSCSVKRVPTTSFEMKYMRFGREGAAPIVILPGLSVQYVTDSAEAVAAAYGKLAADYDLYLFTRGGDFLTHSAYVKLWARILKKLNTAAGGGSFDRVQGLTAHIFRHNYASLLYKQGIDVKTAQKLLGHSSIAVTMDIYTHLEELDAATINAIESAFTARRA